MTIDGMRTFSQLANSQSAFAIRPSSKHCVNASVSESVSGECGASEFSSGLALGIVSCKVKHNLEPAPILWLVKSHEPSLGCNLAGSGYVANSLSGSPHRLINQR